MEDNIDITTNRVAIRKRAKIDMQFYFYNYCNPSLPHEIKMYQGPDFQVHKGEVHMSLKFVLQRIENTFLKIIRRVLFTADITLLYFLNVI